MDNKTPVIKSEVLDDILGLLLSFESPAFKNVFKKINPRKIDMDFIAKTLPIHHWENWMKESFKEELENNDYLIEDENENLSITQKGREFKNNGGYYVQDINKFQIKDLDIHLEKIKKKYDRKLNIIGILIFILQIITIVIITEIFQ